MTQHPKTILAQAQERTRTQHQDYAADVTPAEAWVLAESGAATLVDVRSAAEWAFVGVIPGAVTIEYKRWPGMALNPDFAHELQAQVARDKPVLFLCRSGVRSIDAARIATGLGYVACNILEGFEGDRDASGQRRGPKGWKARGLPWSQG